MKVLPNITLQHMCSRVGWVWWRQNEELLLNGWGSVWADENVLRIKIDNGGVYTTL